MSSNMKSAFKRVRIIVAEQLGVETSEVTYDASFVEDLGADSLDTVELVMAIEEEFETEIPDNEAETISTVRDAIVWIEDNCLKQRTSPTKPPVDLGDTISSQPWVPDLQLLLSTSSTPSRKKPGYTPPVGRPSPSIKRRHPFPNPIDELNKLRKK